MVEVIPGIKVHRRTELTVDEYRGFDLMLVVEIDDSTGMARAVVSSLKVIHREDGVLISSDSLRTIAVQGIVRKYVQMEIRNSTSDKIPSDVKVVAQGILTTAEAERLKELGPVAETLEWVAKVYRLAILIDDAPAKAVQLSFDISRSSAGNWIGRARSAGLIPSLGEAGQ